MGSTIKPLSPYTVVVEGCICADKGFYQVARKTPSLLGRGYKRLVAKRQTNVEFVAVRHIV